MVLNELRRSDEAAMMGMIGQEQARYFRGQLREARAAALKDAEGFSEILLCLERIGQFLTGSQRGLGKYQVEVCKLAGRSPLAQEIPERHRAWHAPFDVLFQLVRTGRNEAVHEGAYARHLATHAIQIAITLEDALMATGQTARDFMVSDPVCANFWEPVSFVRQKMLQNSFSFLPVLRHDTSPATWRLVSETGLAKHLHSIPPGGESRPNRKERLAMSLGDAVNAGLLEPESVELARPETPVHEVAQHLTGRPVLIVHPEDVTQLVGILTAYDLL
jgi:CBS domain-containing protein